MRLNGDASLLKLLEHSTRAFYSFDEKKEGRSNVTLWGYQGNELLYGTGALTAPLDNCQKEHLTGYKQTKRGMRKFILLQK